MIASNIKHILFDLDNTLWDFETNSKEVIEELFSEFELEKKCKVNSNAFLNTYYHVNNGLWDQYKKNEITKEQLRSNRFHLTMMYFDHIDQGLAIKIEEEYIKRSPYRKNLMPFTVEVLDYLVKKYHLHIITNGFKEVQHIKLRQCNIQNYFQNVFISEEIGFNKPAPEIFQFALNTVNCKIEDVIMIGDDWKADIEGAINYGIQAIFYDPKQRVKENPECLIIRDLKALKNML